MFNRKLRFQYGKNPNHVVRMTAKQAKAMNDYFAAPIVLEKKISDDYILETRLTDHIDGRAYNQACKILNRFIDRNGAPD